MNRATPSRWLLLVALTGPALSARAHPLDQQALVKVVRTIDDRQRNSGDYRSLAYLEQKERDKTDTAREAIVYRRSE
ncbi:MAG TPA: outer membrane lipoprotein-sorting protein, partial [Myxococcaceae bacterium]|nr:outer membrane lipoprotein-sorting protein [Myxococcaceae bacterium]